MTFKYKLTALLVVGFLFSVTSCTTSSFTFKSSTKSNSTAKEKRHPHGGPPGQTKKKSNKSRKHVNTFYLGDVSSEK